MLVIIFIQNSRLYYITLVISHVTYVLNTEITTCNLDAVYSIECKLMQATRSPNMFFALCAECRVSRRISIRL